MRIKSLAVAAFCFLHLVTKAQSASDSVLTLQRCLELAYNSNTDVHQAQTNAATAGVNLDLAKGQALPNIYGNIGHSLYNGRSINPYTNSYIDQQNTTAQYQLSASIVLWNGSNIKNYIAQNKLLVEAGRSDVQQARDRTTVTVLLNYLAVLNGQEQLNLARQQADVLRAQVQRLDVLNAQGAVSPGDYHKLKGQLESNEVAVINASNSLENAKIALAQTLNQPYSPGLRFTPVDSSSLFAPYSTMPEEIYQAALQALAVVKGAEFRELAYEKSILSARGAMLPTLSLSGGLFSNYSSVATINTLLNTTDVAGSSYVMSGGSKLPVFTPQPNYNVSKIPYFNQIQNNFNNSISLNLYVPILTGFQLRSRLRQAHINQQQALFNVYTAKTQLRQSIDQNYVNMTSAWQNYRTLLRQVADYLESFRVAQVRFDNGAITSVDYVIAKNDLDIAQLNLISAKYNYILQTKVLDFYQGKPL